MILDTRPLHVTYAESSDKHRALMELHEEDAAIHDSSEAFNRVKERNSAIAELHRQLAGEYALLSALHKDLARFSSRYPEGV